MGVLWLSGGSQQTLAKVLQGLFGISVTRNILPLFSENNELLCTNLCLDSGIQLGITIKSSMAMNFY